jgi:hypothetical protein
MAGGGIDGLAREEHAVAVVDTREDRLRHVD